MSYIMKLGDYYLSPRSNVIVEESDDFEDFDDAADSSECNESSSGSCATPGTVKKLRFKVYVKGNGSLRNAYTPKSKVDIEIARACADEFVVLRRRVNDEHEQQYTLGKGGFTRIIDHLNQSVRERVLTFKVELPIKEFKYGEPPDRCTLSHLPIMDIIIPGP